MLHNFRYTRPATLDQAIARAGRPGARLHAGGTDLLGCLRDRVFEAEEVVSLQGLAELRGIDETADGGLRLGALATLAEVAENPRVRTAYAALAQAAAAVASPQLRNQGTLGGNLCQRPRCWYFRGDFDCLRKGGDTCYALAGENRYHGLFGGAGCVMVHPSDCAAALVALDARVRLAGPQGERTLPLEAFFVLPERNLAAENVLRPGEIVTEVLLPPPGRDLASAYRKVRERAAWDFALVGVALALRLRGRRVVAARVVLAGVAPAPWRAPAAERELAGRELDAATVARAAAAALEGAQPLEQNAFKMPLLRGAVEAALASVAAERRA